MEWGGKFEVERSVTVEVKRSREVKREWVNTG